MVSGSPLYIAQPISSWQVIASAGYTVTALASTGTVDDSVLTQQYRPEYVFWTTSYSLWPFVFVQSSVEGSGSFLASWEVYSNPIDWSGNTYSLINVGVSKWDSAHSLVYVLALISKSKGSSTSIMVSLRDFNGVEGVWTNNAIVNTTLLQGLPNPEIVGVTHTSNAIGVAQAQAGGYFYIGYNTGGTCGGLILLSPLNILKPTITTLVCDTMHTPLEAMAVNIDKSSGYPAVYIIKGGGQLYQLDLVSGSLPISPLASSFSNHIQVLVALSENIFLSAGSGVAIQVADTLEWTWIDNIPGMPEGTAPTLPLLSATGLTPSSTLLLTAYGSNIFSIKSSLCSGHYYWDGANCMPQTCIKIPQCTNDKVFINSACVCKPGFYQLPNLLCSPCPMNSFCNDGGVQTTCPNSMGTVSTQSTSITDCICSSTGQFYSAAYSACTFCLANTWCPNQWVAMQCPGSSSLSSQKNQFPTLCTCEAGFMGPGCVPCTQGYYCPSSTGATAFNMAGYYIGASHAMIPTIQNALLKYFSTPGSIVSSVHSVNDLPVSIQVVEATNQTAEGLMILVQLPDSNGQNWGQIVLFTLQEYATNQSISMIPSGTMPMQSISINPPTLCLTGKTPSVPIASTCICAPGYETNGQQCSPCANNMFKASSGAGSCIPCAVGYISSATGASACVPSLASAPSTTSSTVNVALVAGGVGGGVVGLVLLLAGMHWLFASSSAVHS